MIRLPRGTEARAASCDSRGMDNRDMDNRDMRAHTHSVVWLVGSVVAVGAVFGAPWGGVRAASAQEQSLYIAFSDFNAAPVTDMTRDDIVIQWDGVPCEIVLDAVGVLASEGGAATFFDALYEEAERAGGRPGTRVPLRRRDGRYRRVGGKPPGPGRRGPENDGPPVRQRGGRPHAPVHGPLRRRAHPGPGPGHVGKGHRRVDPGPLRRDGDLHPVPDAVAGDRGRPRPEAPVDPQSVPGDLPAAGGRVRPAAPSSGIRARRRVVAMPTDNGNVP